MNIAALAPDGTVTETGTEAVVKLLVRATFTPPAGAGTFSVTVPVALDPPTTPDGLTAKLTNAGGEIARIALKVVDPKLAETVEVVVDVTVWVTTAKVAVVAPAATVTLVGTEAIVGFVHASATVVPPTGAGMLMVTVPVEFKPPDRFDGLSVKFVSVNASTVKMPVAEVEP